MQETLPSDVTQRIEAHVATGDFSSQGEVMRAALTALDQQKEDWKAISAGIEDMEAGRYRPLAEVEADLRAKHKFLREQ